jgi:PhzF family phenazine biosynthesis protein
MSRLQPLARELNLAETVFVYPAAGDGHARMRIFTPTLELPFAGHPVLGTAFVLGGPLQLEELWLETGAGVVPVRLERDGSRIVFGWMRQPPFRSSRTTARRSCSPCSAWRSPGCRSSSTGRAGTCSDRARLARGG